MATEHLSPRPFHPPARHDALASMLSGPDTGSGFLTLDDLVGEPIAFELSDFQHRANLVRLHD